MLGKTLAILFVFSMIFKEAESLRCYDCREGVDNKGKIESGGPCKNPDDTTHTTDTNSMNQVCKYCIKAEGETKGASGIMRGCVNSLKESQSYFIVDVSPNACIDIDNSQAKGKLCSCDTDLCNDSYKTNALSLFGMLAMMAIMLAFTKA